MSRKDAVEMIVQALRPLPPDAEEPPCVANPNSLTAEECERLNNYISSPGFRDRADNQDSRIKMGMSQ